MFCIRCGKPNPDDAAFCVGCGRQMTPYLTAEEQAPQRPAYTPPAPPTYTPPAYTPPAYAHPTHPVITSAPEEEDSFPVRFRQRWRALLSSPLVLITIICYTAAQLVGFLETNSVFSSVTSILDMAGMSSMVDPGAAAGTASVLTFLQLILAAPGLLTVIGFWLVFADAASRSDKELKTAGLTMIRGVQIAMLTIFCVFMGLGLLGSCSVMNQLSSYYEGVSGTLTFAFLIMVVVTVLVILYYRLLIKVLGQARDGAMLCNPDSGSLTAVAVILFIVGGLNAIGLLSSFALGGFTIPSILNCALPFLFAVITLQFKTMMEQLESEYVYYAAKRRDKAPASEPAWKRVKTGTEPPSAPTPVYSRNMHTGEYIPAWKRVEMAKENNHPDDPNLR